MNNKGMTLVELIVTFSLLLIVILGMFNLIMEVKFELDNKQIAKDFTEYSSIINNDIHYELLKNKPFAIAYKNRPAENWACKANTEGTCSSNGANGFTFRKGTLSSGKNSTELANLCKNIYPCAVYSYVSGNSIVFKIIAFNTAKTDKASAKTLLAKHGIYYNGVYESIPDQEYIEVRFPAVPSIKFDNDKGLLIMDFPFFMVDQEKNYGFKIAYPFS